MTRVGALLAVALAAAGVFAAAPAAADPLATDGSWNVRRVGHVELPGALSIAFSSRAPLAYASARKTSGTATLGGTVATFDISDPTKPKKLAEISVPTCCYMEDIDLGERPDGTAFVLVRGSAGDPTQDAGLQIVDVTNPRKPRTRGYVGVDAHNWTCTTPECEYAYGASPNYPPAAGFPIVDLRDLKAPKRVPDAGGGPEGWNYLHDWDRDSTGVIWGAGGEGLFAYDAGDPEAPALLNSSDENGLRGVSQYNGLQLHGTLRPNGERFQPGQAAASVHDGNVLLASEETHDQDCSDSFQTWYIPHLDAARYKDENSAGLIGGGSITPLDAWSLLENTVPGESRSALGQWCSVHWFDYHQDGFVVLAAYDHGTHVLNVNDARNIKHAGYHFTAGNHAMQSYWVPERDRRGRTTGKASTLAYTADAGDFARVVTAMEPLSGGIDIFEVTLPTRSR